MKSSEKYHNALAAYVALDSAYHYYSYYSYITIFKINSCCDTSLWAAFVLLPLKPVLGCHLQKTWNLCEDETVLCFTGLNVLVDFFLSWKNNCPVFSILIIMHMSVSVGYVLNLVDSTIMKNWWNSCNLGQAYEHEDSWRNMMTLNKQSESCLWADVMWKKKRLGWVQGR